ncbi:MAG: M1 family metallopeptidase, partial [Gemmatimonadota bacterium]
YGGAPRDGLFFGRDGRGEPTAFADNWPNRARWWFPSNDHPSDKAAVRWAVRVPDGYEVIANGTFRGVEAAPGGGGGRVWRWESDPEAPIPTYTMVIGVARFGERSVGEAACGHAPAAPSSCADVTVWPLAGDSAYAVERFARAPDMLDFYAGLVAPYPYEKLAHVESSTRFGGMENASAIFYSMAPWAAREMGEGVIAHETAHQWFGDAVTPAAWSHLWVSEGFASYFGPLYFRARDGEAAFRDLMEAARRAIVQSDATARPVVHDTTDLFALLDTNNYQKGAWVLHMLRGLLGDSTFFRGIRDYYESSAHGTASTDDVRAALEAASGRDLAWFFEQWLYRPGYPRLDVEWWVEPAPGDGLAASRGTLVAAVRQTQPESWPTFRLPTELDVRPRGGGAPVRHPVEITGRADTIRLAVETPVEEVVLDPEGWVLESLAIRRRP